MTGDESRRNFMRAVTVGGTSAVLAGAASADAADRKRGRRVIAGSPYPTFSRAVALDNVVFVAGVVGQKSGTRELASTEFEPQCRQAMKNLKASVEAAGSTMGKVLKCNCFLTDVTDFAMFNKIYAGFFPSDPPARSTVVVKELVVPDAKLEIDCVTCLR